MRKADILAEIVREKENYRQHTDRIVLNPAHISVFATEAMHKLEAYCAVIGTWAPSHEEIWSEMDKPAT